MRASSTPTISQRQYNLLAGSSSIYRASPSKRTKASAGGGSAHSGGGGGSGSGVWTLVGQERDSACSGNPDWPCPRKDCDGFLIARTRKNGSSQCAVCDTRRSDNPSTLKDCDGFLIARTRKNGSSQYAVCDTRRSDNPSTLKDWDGFLIARTRKNGSSQYAVCDTRRSDKLSPVLARPTSTRLILNLHHPHCWRSLLPHWPWSASKATHSRSTT